MRSSLLFLLALAASPSFAIVNTQGWSSHEASKASPFERYVTEHAQVDHARVAPIRILSPESKNSHVSHRVPLSHLSPVIVPSPDRMTKVAARKKNRSPLSRRAATQQRRDGARVAADKLAAAAAGIQVQKATGEEESAWTWMDGDEEDAIVDVLAERRDELPSVARMEFRMRGRKSTLRMA